jgi:ribonuclease HI
MYSLYFDGASKGNPGPASFGGVIYDENKKEILIYNKAIGIYTNIVAEYMGVYMGILICIENGIKKVDIYGNSKIVVEQLKGKSKVKEENIMAIYDKIQDVLHPKDEFFKKGHVFDHITFNYIGKNYNKRAIELVNNALDS